MVGPPAGIAGGTNEPNSAPEAWPRAQALTRRLWSPVERFLHIEAASGLLLLAAATSGLAWANTTWAHSYEALWHAKLSIAFPTPTCSRRPSSRC